MVLGGSPRSPRGATPRSARRRDRSPLPGALHRLEQARNREFEIKKRLVFLTRMLEKHHSGDVAKQIVLERNRRAGEALRAFKDRLFHRDLAHEMRDEPRAGAEEVREMSAALNAAQRMVVPPWETPSWFKLFRVVDSDGSGLISYAEFVDMTRDILQLNEREMPEPRLKALWLTLDADCSGYLTSGEFGAFMKLGQVPVERIGNLERRKAISADQRLDLEGRYAEDVTWEAQKVERDLVQPRHRAAELARRLRATSSYVGGETTPDYGGGARVGKGVTDAGDALLDIEEWLEREYARFHSAIAAAKPASHATSGYEHDIEDDVDQDHDQDGGDGEYEEDE